MKKKAIVEIVINSQSILTEKKKNGYETNYFKRFNIE